MYGHVLSNVPPLAVHILSYSSVTVKCRVESLAEKKEKAIILFGSAMIPQGVSK